MKPTPEEKAEFDRFHGKWVDNPGPDYIASKLRTNTKSQTSGYKHPIMMPTPWLVGLKGTMGEHKGLFDKGQYGEFGENHPQVLDKMKRLEDGDEFTPVHIVGNHSNEPTIHEGNHRVRVAYRKGMEYTPVQLDHMNGHEDFMHPLDIIHEYEDSKGHDGAKHEANLLNRIIKKAIK